MAELTSQHIRNQIAELNRHLREAPPHHGTTRTQLIDRLRHLEQRLQAQQSEEQTKASGRRDSGTSVAE